MKQEIQGVTSVLIPLYNHDRYVKQCLDSLLSSDCSQIELIISDDKSTDDSLKTVEDWLGRHEMNFARTSLLTNKNNLGVTANLNKLVGAASGEFVTILASDDMLAEEAIDKQRDYLMNKPAIDFIFVNCSIVDEGGHIIKQHVVSLLQSILLSFRPYLMLNAMFNWSVIWSRLFARRQKFIEFGPYIEEHSLEDRWSAIKIMNTRRYVFLQDVGYLYRFRGVEAHPMINNDMARRDFHDSERRLHPESKGLLYILLWIRRLPFKTNHGKWPCR